MKENVSAFRFLIIIPTYNEFENITLLINEISNAKAERLLPQNLDVLVVDDSSPDGTSEAVRNLSFDFVYVLDREKKEGLGKAYLEGFSWAIERRYEYVIEMDADFSHRILDLPKLIYANAKIDLVIGSRWIKGGKILNWPFIRIFISKAGNFYARKVLKVSVRDMTSGFRRISVSALKEVDLSSIDSSGYGFQIEMVYLFIKSKKSVSEVPITFIEREIGKSKMNSNIAFEAFLNVTRKAIKNGR